MAKNAFTRIKAGLEDALAYAAGDRSAGKARRVKIEEVDVASLRKVLGLSQDRFAAFFGFSPKTVRNWEQGIRRPDGPARVLLQVIAREPGAVMRALHQQKGRSNFAPIPARGREALACAEPRKRYGRGG